MCAILLNECSNSGSCGTIFICSQTCSATQPYTQLYSCQAIAIAIARALCLINIIHGPNCVRVSIRFRSFRVGLRISAGMIVFWSYCWMESNRMDVNIESARIFLSFISYILLFAVILCASLDLIFVVLFLSLARVHFQFIVALLSFHFIRFELVRFLFYTFLM